MSHVRLKMLASSEGFLTCCHWLAACTALQGLLFKPLFFGLVCSLPLMKPKST